MRVTGSALDDLLIELYQSVVRCRCEWSATAIRGRSSDRYRTCTDVPHGVSRDGAILADGDVPMPDRDRLGTPVTE